MPHSLRVRLKKLQSKGELTEKDIDRIFKALEQEPKTGQWIPFEYGDDTWHKCTSCGCADKYITEVQRPNGTIGRLKSIQNFCPNCGARMVEPQESEDKE